MGKGMWVARQMRERELILEALRTETDPVDSLALRYALNELGSPMLADHFARNLDYLEEKGYIRLQKRSLGRVETKLVEITAKGRDLLSGLISEPGVGHGVGDTARAKCD